MDSWALLLGVSAATGAGCGLVLERRKALAAGAALPWLGMLCYLLYTEYFVPSPGGGASMWPIAQLFAGTAAASAGACGAAVLAFLKDSLP